MQVFSFTGFVHGPFATTSVYAQWPEPADNLLLALITGQQPASWEAEYSAKYDFKPESCHLKNGMNIP